jgi:SAM-dependent methyltransferase
VNLKEYRGSPSEVLRCADILRMIPQTDGGSALDVGVRDGHFSRILAQRFASVTALDLQMPQIDHPKIACVSGDVRDLTFPDDSFDFVLCAEVLEHIPPQLLGSACSELARVTRGHLLIGVPFQQDTRIGRTTCLACGARNPPWGHVNSFDEERLVSLFPSLPVETRSFVGVNDESTNELSALLMDVAGNPYGTYGQDEPCIACGAALTTAPHRTLVQKVCTKAAFVARRVTKPLHKAHPYWMHYLFRKR